MEFAICLSICMMLVIHTDLSSSLQQSFESNPPPGSFNKDPEIEAFCPQKCVNSIYTLLNDQTSLRNLCCIKCRCSQDCVTTGTCCIDFQVNDTHTEGNDETGSLEERCIETAFGDTRVKNGPIDINAHMLIMFCKKQTEKTIDSDVINKCLYPNENIFDEILPVYSNNTERNYRNIYCAMCNEDANSTVAWGTEITVLKTNNILDIFPKNFEIFTNTTVLLELRNNEHILFQTKPNNNKAKECIEQYRVISKCRGSFLNQDKQNCEQGLYSPVKGSLGIYRNVHCFRCNAEENEGNCFKYYLTGFNLASYTVVLGPEPFQAYHRSQPSQNSLNCKNGKIYDHNLVRILL